MIPEGYQSTSLGEIPMSWEFKKLGDALELLTDGTHFSPKSKTGRFKYITSKNIRFGYMDLTNVSYISEEEHLPIYATCPVKLGDVLLTKDGANTGNAALNTLDEEYSLLSSVALLRGKENVLLNQYLLQFFLSPLGQYTLKNEMAGQAITRLTLTKLSNLKVIIPSYKEQQKLSKILNIWDEAISKLELLITTKQKRKRALMQQLLTGKKRFKEFGEPVSKVGELPSNWKEIKLVQVASKDKYSFTGGPFGSNLKAEDYTESGVRIIQLQNMGDGYFINKNKIYTSQEKGDELFSCNIFAGDIIISKMGDPVARACLIPDTEDRWLMASDGIRLKVDTDNFDTNFILEQVNAPMFRKKAIAHSTGSTRQRIGLDTLRNLNLISPPLAEQKKIASVLSSANTEISNHQTQLKALKTQKRGLMQQLLTGKKRVKVEA